MRSTIRFTVGLCLCLALPATAEVTLTCPTGDQVTAPDDALANRACSTLTRALPMLAACHLPRENPLSIIVTDTLLGDHPDCMGVYDCKADQIEVLPPDTLRDLFEPDSPYLRITAEALFESLIVHETTHALIYQVMGPDSGPRAQNEYMAYAMQYASLTEADRKAVLRDWPQTGPVTLENLNGVILAMAPDSFAARVWAHYTAPGNGCDMFRRIIDRDISFNGVHP